MIAYGKLGGKELGYASDLDVIFLYDDPDERAADIYTTYTRRLITWLTTPTGAGALFDLDLRLRPNGEAGLLVTDLDAFRRYQLREGRRRQHGLGLGAPGAHAGPLQCRRPRKSARPSRRSASRC